MGQTERVTVEYMLADGTLDVFIADLLEAKLRLIDAVEADDAPNGSVLDELYEKLRSLGPALLQENKALQATGEIRDRLEALAKTNLPQAPDAPLLAAGVHESQLRHPGLGVPRDIGASGHLEAAAKASVAWRLQTCPRGQRNFIGSPAGLDMPLLEASTDSV